MNKHREIFVPVFLQSRVFPFLIFSKWDQVWLPGLAGPDRAAPETEDSRLPRLPSWQLGDEQIVDAFRAHEANEKHGVDIDKLATLHPFARDIRNDI
eukprot:630015-Amphidinium_carterae.1